MLPNRLPNREMDLILLALAAANLPSSSKIVLDMDFGPIAEQCLKELETADMATVAKVTAALEAIGYDVPNDEPIADVIRQIIAD